MRFIVLFAALLNASAWAQEVTEVDIENVKTTAKVEKELESSDHRKDIKYTLTGSIGNQFSETGLGLNLGYHLKHNKAVEIAIFKSDNDDQNINRFRHEENVSAITASFKMYTGNSFYVKPGVF